MSEKNKKVISAVLIPTIAISGSAHAFSEKERVHGVPDSLLSTEQALLKYNSYSQDSVQLKLDYFGVSEEISDEVLELTNIVEKIFLDENIANNFVENPSKFLSKYNLNFEKLENEKVIQFLQLVVDPRFQSAVKRKDQRYIMNLVQEYGIEEHYISKGSREIYKENFDSYGSLYNPTNQDSQIVWIASAAAVIANVVVGANVIVGAVLVVVAGVYIFVDGPGDDEEEEDSTTITGINEVFGETRLNLSKFKNLTINDIDVKQNVDLMIKISQLSGNHEFASQALGKAVKSEIEAFIDAAYDVGFLKDYTLRDSYIKAAHESGLETLSQFKK